MVVDNNRICGLRLQNCVNKNAQPRKHEDPTSLPPLLGPLSCFWTGHHLITNYALHLVHQARSTEYLTTCSDFPLAPQGVGTSYHQQHLTNQHTAPWQPSNWPGKNARSREKAIKTADSTAHPTPSPSSIITMGDQ